MGFLDRLKKPKAGVSLAIPKSTVELGEDLKGAITVSCQDEFDANEVRAELRCVEKRRREKWVYDEERRRKVRRVYWDIATLHSADPEASNKLHMLPGFKKTFPFNVNIPAGGRESFDGLDASVHWSIKGVVAIKGRPDVTSETIELQVIRPATTPTAVKEKEVAMIPCKYCESLMPETATECPNCGAPRKA
ncbi:MAG: hypothetical protein OEX01_09255 [Candidatus Bathyarchaeota archaeon]|nr:hypothetical protein [Candidatus Bathyarchaeota archaeon]